MSNMIEANQTSLIGVSSQDVKAISAHLKVIKEFVSGEMKSGLDNDYAVIPGTNKRSLLKPGAEKLMRLFHLSSKVECVEKTISPEENFAMFVYKAQIIHIKTGTIVAECEGISNNHEKKYKEKSIYKNGKKTGEKENIPVMDILNTLMKMAQKRAIVGAVILATGASDYFTQDEDEIQKQYEKKPVDNSKFVDVTPNPSGLDGYEIQVGKHKGKTLAEVGKKELTNYLNWISNNKSNIDGKMLEFVNAGREWLREAV